MKFLVALPDLPYYNWQVFVQMNNLLKYNILKDAIYIIGKTPNTELSYPIKRVFEETSTKYFVYDDTRRNPKYPSSLRPHILAKFFKENPNIDNVFFYTDPDVIFSKEFNFDKHISGDTWYVSDTKSYLNTRYIKSKSEKLFEEMCKIVGIDKKIVEDNDDNAGGAQYIMKNIDYTFWETAEKDCENLYHHMKSTENIYHPQHPIQSWTADMWAIFWGALKRNHKIKISEDMNFSWATDNIVKYDKLKIFHNAGVFNQKNMFNKIQYQKTPFISNFSYVSGEYCSSMYVKEIEETKTNFPELVKLF